MTASALAMSSPEASASDSTAASGSTAGGASVASPPTRTCSATDRPSRASSTTTDAESARRVAGSTLRRGAATVSLEDASGAAENRSPKISGRWIRSTASTTITSAIVAIAMTSPGFCCTTPGCASSRSRRVRHALRDDAAGARLVIGQQRFGIEPHETCIGAQVATHERGTGQLRIVVALERLDDAHAGSMCARDLRVSGLARFTQQRPRSGRSCREWWCRRRLALEAASSSTSAEASSTDASSPSKTLASASESSVESAAAEGLAIVRYSSEVGNRFFNWSA